jgi:hypothetical protein
VGCKSVVFILPLGAVCAWLYCAPTLADGTTTCAAVGQSVDALSTGVDGTVLAAVKAGRAAEDLPGTRARSNPLFHVVEGESANAETSAGTALSGLGPLVGADFGDASVQKATDAVTTEAKAEIAEALAFSRFALHFERAVNTKNVASARIAFAVAMSAFARSSTYSVTNGSVGGQNFSATTTTTTSNANPPVVRAPQSDPTLDQMATALTQEGPQLEMLPYTFHPLINHWIAACRAAGQLPPPASATP